MISIIITVLFFGSLFFAASEIYHERDFPRDSAKFVLWFGGLFTLVIFGVI